MKIGIVGGGIMGLATAWALRRQGAAVEIFEQYALPNPIGSSVDHHRLIRYPYGSEAGYTAMVRDAFAAWARLWADLGDTLYVETGTLAIDSAGADWARRSAATMDALGLGSERLTGDDLARRHPHLRGDNIATALYQPQGGFLMAGRIVERLAHHLGTTGVALHAHTKVAAIDPERARLTLASGAVHGFDRIVVAAGPWIAKLVPGLAPRAAASRQLVAYVAPPPDFAASWARSPMLIDMGVAQGVYAVPPRAGLGLKFGDHRFSLDGDPDEDRTPRQDEIAKLLEGIATRVREVGAYRILEAKTCYYDVEPQERFILEPLGAQGWVLSGFSGHGFKFGALIGEVAADAVTGQRPAEAARRYAAGLAA